MIAEVPTEIAITLLTLRMLDAAKGEAAELQEIGASEQDVTSLFVSSHLLFSVNFALERGQTSEGVAAELEAFAARLRSGESRVRASERQAQYEAWAAARRATAEEPAAEKGGA